MIDLTKIDKSWTLFLDRDGVINEESITEYEYILKWEEFRFMQGAKEAIKIFAEKFSFCTAVSLSMTIIFSRYFKYF